MNDPETSINTIRLGIFGYSNIQIIETLMEEVTKKSAVFSPFIRKATWDGTTFIGNRWVSFEEDGELCLDMLSYKAFTKNDIVYIFNEVLEPDKYKESFDKGTYKPFDVAWCAVKFFKILEEHPGKPLDPFMQGIMSDLIRGIKSAGNLWQMLEIDMIFKNGVMQQNKNSEDVLNITALGELLKSKYEEILTIEKLCDD